MDQIKGKEKDRFPPRSLFTKSMRQCVLRKKDGVQSVLLYKCSQHLQTYYVIKRSQRHLLTTIKKIDFEPYLITSTVSRLILALLCQTLKFKSYNIGHRPKMSVKFSAALNCHRFLVAIVNLCLNEKLYQFLLNEILYLGSNFELCVGD